MLETYATAKGRIVIPSTIRRKRLGKDADTPHRVVHRKLHLN